MNKLNKVKKHAYLILCHADLKMLQILVGLLDDERNDLFIHIDHKANFTGDELTTKMCKLYVLKQRLDARWGDYSLVKAEFLLFEKAYNTGSYSYYHVLSGSDLPLKSQDYIHAACYKNPNINYIGFSGINSDKEAQWRTEHYFLFSRSFRSKNILTRSVRRLFLLLQDVFMKRHVDKTIKKGPQWCSVTHEFVTYLLKHKDWIKNTFSNTFCPDELFIQTLCWNSAFRDKVYDATDEFGGCKRYIKWVNGTLQDMTSATTNEALLSDKWFARKYSSADFNSIKQILSHLA